MNDVSRGSNSAEHLWELDRRHVLHPWATLETFEQDGALIIDKGDGLYIEDTKGNRYLDAVGGLWCTNIGLGNAEVADAMAAQVRRLTFANPFVDMGTTPAAELAAKLASLAPGDLSRVLFTTGGSTANDSAYRLSQFYHSCRGKPQKRNVFVRKQSYHGSTYLTASMTGKDMIPDYFEYKQDTVHFLTCPNPYRRPDGVSEEGFSDFLVNEFRSRIAELGADTVGAYFAEPIFGAGGVIVPPEDYNKRMWEVCKENDILYVSDEVVTAFGRLGHWFAASGEYGFQPDMIACAKGLTAGYIPLGALIYSDAIHETIAKGDPGRFFGHGFTYSGHPVACATSLKVLEILEREKILDNVKRVGPYFEQRLHELADLPLVGNVRGRKLMMCIEFVQNRQTKELFPEEQVIGKRIANHAEAMGLIVRPIMHLNIMSPALILEKQDVDFIVDTLRTAILAAARELDSEGVPYS